MPNGAKAVERWKRAPRELRLAIKWCNCGWREPLPSLIGASYIRNHAVEACHPQVCVKGNPPGVFFHELSFRQGVAPARRSRRFATIFRSREKWMSYE